MSPIGDHEDLPKLERSKENERNAYIKVSERAGDSFLEPHCTGCSDYDQPSNAERLRPAVPSEMRFNKIRNEGAHALAVRPVLPAKHLPQRMLLEQRSVIEIPLVAEKHIHRVTGDPSEKPRCRDDENNPHQTAWQPVLLSLCGRYKHMRAGISVLFLVPVHGISHPVAPKTESMWAALYN